MQTSRPLGLAFDIFRLTRCHLHTFIPIVRRQLFCYLTACACRHDELSAAYFETVRICTRVVCTLLMKIPFRVLGAHG